jgi:membrane protease YdiL (CAAX protease family)
MSGSLARAAPAWLPIALVAMGSLVPPLRVPVLAVVLLVALATLVRQPGRPTGPGVAWIAVLPVAVGFAMGLIPDPGVADPGACDDVLAQPVLRRLLQAAAVLGTTAVLAVRMGGRRSLGIVLPPDRRVTALAVACPVVLVPVAIWIGPILAQPFFDTVVLGVPSLAALVPAAIIAVANAALEEVAYRGALQRWGAPALGRTGAIVAQAILFGCAHQGSDIAAGGALILAGMVLAGLVAGLVADRTRSLLLPFAAHAAIDIPIALYKTCRIG